MQKELSVCEEKTFRKVYEEQGNALKNFLYYKFGSFEAASDHAQEAFIRLWNKCAEVPFEKARSFLFTTAKRLFLDDLAHQKVELKFVEKQEHSPSIESPEFVLEESEFKNELERAISDLPEKQRVIFLMNRIDNIPYKEIAEIQDISLKTVEKHMSSALRQLKDKVDVLKYVKI
ncbi:MAG: RNA polymerase sigma factor (sigma-70 family) [Cyclobacteriaceae bacterium]